MVSCKVILAVAVASMAFVAIEGKPSTVVEDWTKEFETAFQNISSKVTDFVGGDHSSFAESAKNNLNKFADALKEQTSSFTKTLDSKSDIAAMFNESTKQLHSAVESLSKNMPTELSPEKVNEKFQETLKTITQNASELTKKVQGTDMEKTIKEFTKKQYDALAEQYQAFQKKFAEPPKQQ